MTSLEPALRALLLQVPPPDAECEIELRLGRGGMPFRPGVALGRFELMLAHMKQRWPWVETYRADVLFNGGMRITVDMRKQEIVDVRGKWRVRNVDAEGVRLSMSVEREVVADFDQRHDAVQSVMEGRVVGTAISMRVKQRTTFALPFGVSVDMTRVGDACEVEVEHASSALCEHPTEVAETMLHYMEEMRTL